MTAFIGIDLGTTFSAVATLDDTGRPAIVHNVDGKNLTPSCVTEEDGIFIVGDQARRALSVAPTKVAARFKREMGTSSNRAINGRLFTPTELSALVLKKLVKDAQRSLGSIGEAVVTIPANFSNEAREATMTAARSAGLNVRYIINEPTAAALYYAFKSGQDLHGTYAVYDLGGGTFDVSVIRVEGQDVEVVASNGVNKLGGDDFDEALVGIVARKYAVAHGEQMDAEDFSKFEAEQEKISLSERKRSTAKVGRRLIEITREEFEEAISAKVAQAEMLCEATLDEAGLTPEGIRGVFLAGGSTRIPVVRDSVRRIFNQEPIATANVDEVVALGAALYSAYKGNRSLLSAAQQAAIANIAVAERTSKCFGTIALGHDEARGQPRVENTIMIAKNERIPCAVTKSFYTVRDGQDGVDCTLTESTAPETDPRFVKIIWKGELPLPGNRPAEQEIRVTYAYDENQMMRCSFVDVATGREKVINMSMTARDADAHNEIEQFLVE